LIWLSAKTPEKVIHRAIIEKIENISGLYKVDIVYLVDVDEEFKKYS
jgi:hypothetical protein